MLNPPDEAPSATERASVQRGLVRVTVRSFLGGISEFLAADARFEHQPTLGDSKRRHALVVGTGSRGVMFAAAGAGGVTRRVRGGGRAGGDGDRGCLYAELELTGGEFVEGALVLKEHNLAIALAAELPTDRQLFHRGVADVRTSLVDPALAVGAADAHAGFADGRENRVTVAVVEKIRTRSGFPEYLDGFGVIVRPGATR